MDWSSISSTGVGAFLGVLSGLIVNLITTSIHERSIDKQQIKNAIFELEYIRGKMNDWAKSVKKIKQHISSDSMDDYYTYFDLSKCPNPSVNSIFQSGLLYKHITHEQMAQLFRVFSTINENFEGFFNSRIKFHKEHLDKQAATKDANYWEDMFEEHAKHIGDIIQSLSR